VRGLVGGRPPPPPPPGRPPAPPPARGLPLRPLVAVLTLALLALACAPATPRAPGAPAAPPPSGSPPELGGATRDTTSVAGGAAPAAAEPIEALYAKAQQEGSVSLYATINAQTAQILLPAFEARYPGVKVDWVDGTAERLAARIIAETRGGKVLVDVLQTNIENIAQLYQQRLVADLPEVPEAAGWPDTLKGPYWLASDLKFYVAAWNTNLVRPDEAPRQFDDFADPRWKGRLLIDPGDYQLLVALARHKLGSEDAALDVLRRIAANDPEFHAGHSELVELVTAGQGAACLTCFSHHFPPRLKRGAPVDYLLAEGVGLISANGVFKNAPHPNAAQLWVRWVASDEGQQTYAAAGATPANPAVAPLEKTRPERIYALTADDLPDFARAEKQWREVFRLR
jgi:iron(III) transport system substrate-binding protein